MNIERSLSIELLIIAALLTFVCYDARAIGEEIPLVEGKADLITGLDCNKIQQCIDKASSGDTILITAGTYFENLTLDKNLTLQGEGKETTIIDGQAINPVVTISNHVTATMANLAITNGTSGIHNEGTLTLNHCTISHNINGGISNWHDKSVLTINSCTIKNNSITGISGGIYNGGGKLLIINSTIGGNSDGRVYSNGELILPNVDNRENNFTDVGNWGIAMLREGESSSSQFGNEVDDVEGMVILHNSNFVRDDSFGIYNEEITTLLKREVASPVHVINEVNLEAVNSEVSGNISNINGESSLMAIPSTPTLIYVSSSSSGKVGGIAFNKEDILVYSTNTNTWSLYFDGSDVGLAGADLNAFHLQNDGSLLLSLQDANFSIPSFDIVQASDIVRFLPTSLGEMTQGNFEWYFDGSDVGLSSVEGIDAIGFTIEGDLLVSIIVGFQANDIDGADKDLLVFKGSSFGKNTAGIWSLYFDGSDVNLGGPTEDIYGAWLNPNNGDLYLTTLGGFSVAEFSGDTDDIFIFTPNTLGDNTEGSFDTFWDGDLSDLTNEWIDGLFLQ